MLIPALLDYSINIKLKCRQQDSVKTVQISIASKHVNASLVETKKNKVIEKKSKFENLTCRILDKTRFQKGY